MQIAEIKKFLEDEKLECIKTYDNGEWLKILVATARSKRHIISFVKKLRLLKLVKAEDVFGSFDSEWIICSFFDYDLHLFSQEKREYYDIDQLWGAYELR